MARHSTFGPHWPGPRDVARANDAALSYRANGGPAAIAEAVMVNQAYIRSIQHREVKGQPVPKAGYSVVPPSMRPKQYEAEA